MKKIFIIITVLLIGSTTIKAQVTVDNTSMTVEQYIQNVLAGPGVTITNVQFNGSAANALLPNEQVGSFNDVNSDVGLTNGVILGSGNVAMAAQLNTAGGNSLGGSGTAGVDVDLASITPNQIFDESVVEFDFVPQGDTIKFNYVFASEEYEEFVCGTVNDAFGFFLTGVNPNGGSYTAQNLALIPDPLNPTSFTNIPVSINTVNQGPNGGAAIFDTLPCFNLAPNWASYSVFYTPNTTNTYEYDGKTVVLQAKAFVNCGQTYHIKLAIGDGGDGVWDSGVFLEGGSFSSAAVQVNVVAATGDSTVIEGCAGADIVFTRPDTIGDFTVHYVIGGTAINDTDYAFIPDSITFPAGVDTAVLNILPIADFIPEPQETITITVTTIDPCGNPIISTGIIYILDLPNMIISSNDTNLACQAATIPISVQASNALEPFTYVWTDTGGNTIGTNNDTIQVSGLVTDTFYVSVTDSCNLVTLNDTIIVSTIVNPPIIDSTTVDSLINCGESISLEAFLLPNTGTAPFSFSWSGINVNPSPPLSPTADSTFYVTVTDFCGLTDIDSVIVTVDTIPVTIIVSNDTTVNCPNLTFGISASPADGVTPYSYTWTPGGIGGSINVSPTQDETYTVTANGLCGATITESVNVFVNYNTMTASLSNDITFPCPNLTYPIEVIATPTGGTAPYSYDWTPTSTDIDNTINISVNTSQTITTTITDDCNLTANGSMNIFFASYTPLTVSTVPVDSTCANELVNLSATATNGVPPYSYLWSNGNTGSLTTFTSSVLGENIVTVTVTDECTEQESTNMIVDIISCEVDVFSVITPNGDGTNDFLMFKGIENFPNNRLTVLNRWGTTLLEIDNYKNDWDGDNANEGTYFYVLELNNSANTIHKGTFTLLK